MDSSRSAPIAVARSNGRPGRGTLRNAWPQQRASVARARQPSRVGRINSHHDAKSSPQPKFCTKRALRASLTCRCSAAALRVRGPGRPASRRSRPLLAARFDSGCATHIFTCVLTRGTRQAGCGGAGRSHASVKWSLIFYPTRPARPLYAGVLSGRSISRVVREVTHLASRSAHFAKKPGSALLHFPAPHVSTANAHSPRIRHCHHTSCAHAQKIGARRPARASHRLAKLTLRAHPACLARRSQSPRDFRA